LIKEIKRHFSGEKEIYQCESIILGEKFALVKYTVEKTQKVGSIILYPGTLSYGFFWRNRPYTLYKWKKDEKIIGNYFNVADAVRISKGTISWRDLVVDILVLPSGRNEVLDEDQLQNISSDLEKYIEKSKNIILNNYRKIIDETDALIRYLKSL